MHNLLNRIYEWNQLRKWRRWIKRWNTMNDTVKFV